MEFLYLCCAVYLPSIPATVLQFMCDRTVDRAIGSKMSYGLRSFIYFLTMGSIMVYLPLGPAKRRIGDPGWHRQPHLLIAVTILGFFSALAYGSFFQLVSILDQKGEKKICTAIFSMGYQGAGIIAMFLSFWTDFKTNPSQLQTKAFFWGAAFFEFFAGFAYYILALKSDIFLYAITARDEEATEYLSRQASRSVTPKIPKSAVQRSYGDIPLPKINTTFSAYTPDSSSAETTRLVSANGRSRSRSGGDGMDRSNSGRSTSRGGGRSSMGKERKESSLQPQSYEEEPSELEKDWMIFKQVAPCVIAIFLNIFASVFLLPFYPFFPSAWRRLPQILFFTKLVCDTLGRPLTLIFPLRNQIAILILSVLRVGSLFVFFLDMLGYLDWDALSTVLCVGVFSLASGFVGTSAYQFAPAQFDSSFEKTQVANMLNLSFHFAVGAALLSSAFVTNWLNEKTTFHAG